MNSDAKKPVNTEVAITRRRMLMRLGLVATAAYVAPALLQLSEARASSRSGPSRNGRYREGVRRNSGFTGPSRGPGPRAEKFSGPSNGRERVRRRGTNSRPSFSR